MTEEKYISLFTDFGFKKLFGEEANKDLLIDFLNSLLNKEHKIKDLIFKKTEHLGSTEMNRKAIYDLYCEDENGQKFIVELQKAEIANFTEEQKFAYEESMKYYRDLKNVIDKSYLDGANVGFEKGKIIGFESGKTVGFETGKVEGKNQGMLEGEIIGTEKTKGELIIDMYNEGFSIDVISKVSKCSIEKINEILKKDKN
ncbi:MAG: PD-(D/E)XK nuclease family transposase [Candidatus Sericytochromatia bacterium]